jgi:hypothetical protein
LFNLAAELGVGRRRKLFPVDGRGGAGRARRARHFLGGCRRREPDYQYQLDAGQGGQCFHGGTPLVCLEELVIAGHVVASSILSMLP